MKSIHFTVDSALLRELGERLVGRPHIALAELIKNSYDADALTVEVELSDGAIVVRDNGHGMTFDAFRDFWMRIGSPHKQRRDTSPEFGRPLTGSKGVGRLSAQFLGRRLSLRTVAKNQSTELYAEVNWDEAVESGELTSAEAHYEERSLTGRFPLDQAHGTEVTITALNHTWPAPELVQLAREVWWLQVPFTSPSPTAPVSVGDFQVNLIGPQPEIVEQFSRQMRAFLEVWEARLLGRLLPTANDDQTGKRQVELILEYRDRERQRIVYDIEPCRLEAVTFEVRAYQLRFRQPFGLRVDEVREYLQRFGGVHIYDASFHLPYYGVDTDWLRIEQDASRRLARSQLLPSEFQVPDGLLHLPRNPNLFGVVNVDTAYERRQRESKRLDHLSIQLSRDRLVDNGAFQDLAKIVRWAVDYYAMSEARRAARIADESRAVMPVSEKAQRVEQVLERYSNQIPPLVYASLRSEVDSVVEAVDAEAERTRRQLGLLGALATAGISALAYEHEVAKQLGILDALAARMGALQSRHDDGHALVEMADQLIQWTGRARGLRSVFAPLLSEENREAQARFKARGIIDDVGQQLRPLLRNLAIDTSLIDPSFRLPRGTYVEWTSIFQNVVTNASNAMLDCARKELRCESRVQGSQRAIIIQDTGTGVDLDNAQLLFEPFERRQSISPERQQLGLGGMGLGLTIVRMIATGLGCQVGFVAPSDAFSTAFRIAWRESDG